MTIQFLNPIILGPYLKKKKEIFGYSNRHTQRGNDENRNIRRGPHRSQKRTTFLILNFRLQVSRAVRPIGFCCLSQPVHGILL